MSSWLLVAAVVVGTWNAKWFPSGRAEHRANPMVEAATTEAAGRMLGEAIRRVDPRGTNGVILVLNEIRGLRDASNLLAKTGIAGLRLASISGYRRRDRFDMQQDVVATTLPIAAADWRVWPACDGVKPPRGYAHAAIVIEPAVTAQVYAVHLKSNYGAMRDVKAAADNRRKRESAASSLVAAQTGAKQVIVAGDMNIDPWRKEFASEQTLQRFEAAGFIDILAQLPADHRGTYPNHRYGDSALDHILLRGFESARQPFIEPNDELSDHRALFGVIVVAGGQR